MIKKVAIITTYFPSEENISGIRSIVSQVDLMIVCDNSSKENSQSFSGIPKCEYLFFNRNLGISKAFNLVLKDQKYNWQDEDFIFFFDQDSKIQEGHINRLLEEYKKIEDKDSQIGCLGPVWLNAIANRAAYSHEKRKSGQSYFAVNRIITSSLVCRYNNLKMVGFWNEQIFLDMADWDICWRFQWYGKKCYITDNVIMSHELGNEEKKIGFIKLKVGVPIREYYQTRDGLKLITKKYVPLNYKIRLIAQITLRPILHALFLNDPLIRMKYIREGFRDYLVGKNGEYI